MKRLLVVLVLGASAWGQSMPAGRPAFTVGKETTLVEGPVKADGTIDYIPAINALLGTGVKNEENAAIPLMLLRAGGSKDEAIDPRMRQILETLHVTIPEKVGRLDFLFSYAERKKGVETITDPEESQRLAELEDKLILRPWKAQEQPMAAGWIDASADGLKLVEEASGRTKFYMPFCAPTGKSVTGLEGSAGEAMPFLVIRMPLQMLLSRAQMRAGSGDVAGALADVRTVRKLARIAEQEHLGLIHLQALAVEYNALRTYAGMAACGTLTPAQLAAVRQEILALPVMSDEDPIRDKVDEMMALDTVMQCIAGRSPAVMRLMAFDISGTAKMDLSDWKNADWDVMLRETIKLAEADVPGSTFIERSKNWEKKLADEPQGPSFFDNIMSFADGGNFATIAERVNAFLQRRAGESREDYTRRVTRWLMGANISDVRRNLGLGERPRTGRVLALTCVALAEYRLAQGAYPESLEKLEPVPEVDGFTGKPLAYRREGEGFKLWSAGLNQKDDGGAKDDMVVGSEIGK